MTPFAVAFSTSAPSAAARQGWAPGVTAAPLRGVPFTPGRLSGAVGSRRVPWPGRSAPSFHSSSSHRSAAKATHLSADPDSQFPRATSAHALLPGCSLPPLPRPPPGTARTPESGRSSVTTRGPLPLLGVCGFSTSGTGATQDGSAPLEQRASAAPTRGPRGPRRAVGAGRGPRTRASAGPASPEASVLGVQVAGGNFGTLICGVRSIA